MVLYYTPDSQENIEPRTLEPGTKVYDHDEALKVWRERGGEPRYFLVTQLFPLSLSLSSSGFYEAVGSREADSSA